MGDQRRSLVADALSERLVPDPNSPKRFVLESGYLGKSTREGFWRLYLNSEMNAFQEFAEKDIIHTQSLETADNPMGGTAVWIKANAEVLRARIRSSDAQEAFLHGDITTRMMRIVRPSFAASGFASATSLTAPISATITFFICDSSVLNNCDTDDCPIFSDKVCPPS